MVGTGQAVEAASRAQNIDDAFALAVWWTETNDGAAGVGLADRNPGSVRGSVGYPSAYDGYTIYPSFSAAVTYWFSMLKKVYIDRGLTTVSAISHPYVGTSTSYLWAGKVIALMQRYRGEAPPSAVSTSIAAIPSDLKRQGQQLSQDQQQLGTGKSTYYPPDTATGAAQVYSLSGNVRTLVVLFDLCLALALALGAWSVNKRYAKRPQPAFAPQVVNNAWGQIRASSQQPASLFNNFSGALQRTTEDLVAGPRTTEALVNHNRSEELLPVGAFASSPAQFQSAWTPQPRPVPAWTSQAGAAFSAATFNPEQASAFAHPGLARPTPSPLHRHRLQPTGFDDSSGADPQPQPAGASSGGLLSRYRETQTQNSFEIR
jgi:hypothetical protein